MFIIIVMIGVDVVVVVVDHDKNALILRTLTPTVSTTARIATSFMLRKMSSSMLTFSSGMNACPGTGVKLPKSLTLEALHLGRSEDEAEGSQGALHDGFCARSGICSSDGTG